MCTCIIHYNDLYPPPSRHRHLFTICALLTLILYIYTGNISLSTGGAILGGVDNCY